MAEPNERVAEQPAWAGALLAAARRLATLGLNSGTAGNLSVRFGDGLLITPSAMLPERMRAEDMVLIDANGSAQGVREPSSEWQLHRDLYLARPEAGAVIHVHSPFATALACQRRDIPPFHYTIARFGGDSIRCSGHHTFGSAELSAAVVAAMEARTACLMANHGATVIGRNLDHALQVLREFESLCELYWRTRQLGPPVLLTAEEMAAVVERYRSYGKPA
jgi:L-fuculose-phosphate aldolase